MPDLTVIVACNQEQGRFHRDELGLPREARIITSIRNAIGLRPTRIETVGQWVTSREAREAYGYLRSRMALNA